MKYLAIGYPYLNLKVLTNTHGDLSVALRYTRRGERSYTYVRKCFVHKRRGRP